MSRVNTVVTRFAPSPSGHLHVGGARTALFNWAYARSRGGTFILRIEDTDQKRSSEASGMAFLEDLNWLGIDWNEGPEFEGLGGGKSGPYFQSKRRDIYDAYVQQLIDSGRAYRAFETAEELNAKRDQARKDKRTYRYDRAALELDQQTVQKYLEEGRPHVVRLKIPEGEPVIFRDEVRGEMRVEPEELDDFVIIKADGWPTYHFAVVVDDELMGVTHVIRAEEHLKNTAKHLLIQQALDFRTPVYAHVSVVMNPNGSKMSKREKDKALRAAVREMKVENPPQVGGGGDAESLRDDEWAWWLSSDDNQLRPEVVDALSEALGVDVPEIDVDDFRRAGYLPEVMVNYLALLGWNPGHDIEKFDREFLIENFSLDRIIKSPAKFDREKLLAFNLDALQEMPPEDFHVRLREHAERYHKPFLEKLGDEKFELFARANQSRVKTLDDPFRTDHFFVVDDDAIQYEDSKPVKKALVKGEPNGYTHLEAILPMLRNLEDWSAESLERVLTDYAEQHADGKLGKIAQPLRVAVTGGPVSPAIYDTLVILGKDSTRRRIEHCLAQRETVKG